MRTASTAAGTNSVTLKTMVVDIHGKFQHFITKGRRNLKDSHLLKNDSSIKMTRH
jgi:hypothetical protein